MASGFSGADLFRLLASMALVLALMGALLWALRRLQGRMNSQNPGRRLQLIEALSVGTRQKNRPGSRGRAGSSDRHQCRSNVRLGQLASRC